VSRVAIWRRGFETLGEAARLRPDWVDPLNVKAWALATSENEKLRNGPAAVQIAEKAAALTSHKQPAILHILAAAYAEAGRFSDAVETANQAIALAERTGSADLVAQIKEALEFYKRGQPFRQKAQVHK